MKSNILGLNLGNVTNGLLEAKLVSGTPSVNRARPSADILWHSL